ncbi:B12-binding domain-containing radical SAM protein [Dehalococcoidia bacterium]|nr:B12-binding domain-containing radical SAM protein [Dehalococcoidia bacterium]
MRILLANPPWIEEGRYGIRAGSRWAHLQAEISKPSGMTLPFFLAYATAVLERGGHEVKLIDAIPLAMTEDEFIKQVDSFKPNLLVVETSTPTYARDTNLVKKIRDSLEVRTALCGAHVTALPEEALQNSFIDFVLMGEYEETLLELVSRLDDPRAYPKINGIAFKESGEIKINPRRPLIKNLDWLPYPAWDQLPIDKYDDSFTKHKPNFQMLASRGCPFRCTFCLEPYVWFGPSFRAHSPRRVVDEMEYVMAKYQPKQIYFDDSTFTVGENRILKLCEEIKSRGIDIPWSCLGSVNTVSKRMLIAMKEAGCEGIKLGIESGSNEMLRQMKKPFNTEQVKKAFQWCHEIGIRTHGTIIIGMPGETKQTIRASIDLASKLKLDSIQFSLAIPFPGTAFFEQAKANNWLTTYEWSKYDGGCGPVARTEYLRVEEIKAEFLKAVARYNFRVHKGKLLSSFWESLKNRGLAETSRKSFEYIRAALR